MLIVFDTETTGLSEDAQVVSLAAVQLGDTPDTDNILMDCVVRPVRDGWQTATETTGAFAVNGHTVEQIAATKVFLPMVWSDFICRLERLPTPATLIAHNALFDRRVLAQSLAGDATCAAWARAYTHDWWGCTRNLPWPSTSRSLDAICEHYGITAPSARHTALGDCQRLAQALRCLHGSTSDAPPFLDWVADMVSYVR